METIHTIEWMKQVARQARAEGRSTGFVPTMGALHEGHLSLVRAAIAESQPVIASIFVNPTQFGPSEDFQKYPRTLEADSRKLEDAGVDYLFAPEASEIYPPGFRTWVDVEGLSERLEGRARPRAFSRRHDRGPEAARNRSAAEGVSSGARTRSRRASSGRWRAICISDSEIVVCPIVREPDGLAMSSRNAYLNPEERRAATILFRALDGARASISRGERDALRLTAAMREALRSEPLADPDYVELVDAETLEPVTRLRGVCLALLAVRIGAVRLIDNLLIEEREGAFHTTL